MVEQRTWKCLLCVWNQILFIINLVILICIAKEVLRSKDDMQEIKHESALIKRKYQAQEEPVILMLSGNTQTSVGSGYQEAIRGWEINYMQGNITFFQDKYIKIEIAGFYYVSLQLIIWRSKGVIERKNNDTVILDIGVFDVKTLRRLLAASFDLRFCEDICTRNVQNILKLEKGDILGVNSMNLNIFIRMMRSKNHFSVYLVKNQSI